MQIRFCSACMERSIKAAEFHSPSVEDRVKIKSIVSAAVVMSISAVMPVKILIPDVFKAGEILGRLKEWGITSFRMLFKGSRSRSEVVATFIAVLELCKARMIHLAGSETDCTVTPTGEGGDTLTL